MLTIAEQRDTAVRERDEARAAVALLTEQRACDFRVMEGAQSLLAEITKERDEALADVAAAEAPLTDIVLRHHAAMLQVERERDEARTALTAATARAVKAEKERDEADSTASFVLRPEVAAFAMLMEEKLLLSSGTGRVPLVPSLAETLGALSDGPHSASELSEQLGTSATAMNNRLEELRALGLVRRSPAVPRGDGR